MARILKNPKYTGRVVLGRTRNAGTGKRKGERKVRPVPRAYWTWAADGNTHTELVDMDLWERAQVIGAERGNVRDTEYQTPASGQRTVYPLRARIRCHKCQRRLHGITRPGRKPGTSKANIYYLCPHNPKNPRHAQHARTSIKRSGVPSRGSTEVTGAGTAVRSAENFSLQCYLVHAAISFTRLSCSRASVPDENIPAITGSTGNGWQR